MGLRFDEANQLLEYIRRAMELRRSSASSWEDHDVWRAVDDHIMVAKNSKVKLERRAQISGAIETIRLVSSSSSSSSDSSSSDSAAYRKWKKKRKKKWAKKKRTKRHTKRAPPTSFPPATTVAASKWISTTDLARNQCSLCKKFGHWRKYCPKVKHRPTTSLPRQMNTS